MRKPTAVVYLDLKSIREAVNEAAGQPGGDVAGNMWIDYERDSLAIQVASEEFPEGEPIWPMVAVQGKVQVQLPKGRF